MMAAAQRLRQGLRALFAFTREVDVTLPAQCLTPEQVALFRRMQRSEQLHGIQVLRAVQAQRESTPDDLARAALLHDVGKICHPLPVWGKTFGVLLRAGMPGLFDRWSRGDVRNPLKRACVVMTRHPAWGAELVAQTGASERVVWLVAHHAEPEANWRDHPHFDLLARLQQADDLN